MEVANEVANSLPSHFHFVESCTCSVQIRQDVTHNHVFHMFVFSHVITFRPINGDWYGRSLPTPKCEIDSENCQFNSAYTGF